MDVCMYACLYVSGEAGPQEVGCVLELRIHACMYVCMYVMWLQERFALRRLAFRVCVCMYVCMYLRRLAV